MDMDIEALIETQAQALLECRETIKIGLEEGEAEEEKEEEQLEE